MKLGMFTSCLHDRDLESVIEEAQRLGHTSLELNSGGFFRDFHIHTSELLVSERARSEFLGKIARSGLSVTSLNNNGNPLHPDREVGPHHLREMHDAIDLAALLGIGVVVMQSGNPGAEPTSTTPSWVVSPWDSAYIDVLDYQWSLAVPLWKEVSAHAADKGVKIAIEMHPHQLVYNPTTLGRLIEETGSDVIGMEMDPSHLFWQGIDPVATIERFGDRVFMSAAKDTKIYPENLAKHGFLNNLWRRNEGANMVAFTGRYSANDYPLEPSYEFVSIGKGHDTDFWSQWLAALYKVNPGISVQIEHEDPHMGRIEGLEFATNSLNEAAAKAGISFEPPASVKA